MKTYLGLDLGANSLGIAISRSGIISENYKTLYFKTNDYNSACDLIIDEIRKLKVDIVVLGLPKHMNNDLGERAIISNNFKNMILEKEKVEVILWDERLSTKSALKILSLGNIKKKKQKSLKDEMAAKIILQNYLDYINNQR